MNRDMISVYVFANLENKRKKRIIIMSVCHTCPVGGLWWHGRVGYVLFRSWKVLQCGLLLGKMMRMWRTGFIIATINLIFQIPAKTVKSNSIRSLLHSNVPDSIPDTHSKTRYSGRPHEAQKSRYKILAGIWNPDLVLYRTVELLLSVRATVPGANLAVQLQTSKRKGNLQPQAISSLRLCNKL